MIWDEMSYNQLDFAFGQKLEVESEKIEVNIAEEYVTEEC